MCDARPKCNKKTTQSLKILEETKHNQHFLMTREMFRSLDCHAKGKITCLYLHSFILLEENNDQCSSTQMHDCFLLLTAEVI